jgi:hypothetical protein
VSVRLSFKTQSYYVKQARFGAVDVLENDLLFSGPNSGTLNLVIAPGNAQVSGSLINDAGQPLKGSCCVVFVPDKGRQFIVRLADEEGRFTAQGIPPGDYRVFASQNPEDYAFRNAEFLARIRAYGVPLHVTEGSNPVLAVKPIPASLSDAR